MNRLLRVCARRQAPQSGVASIEFALILPFMLLILFAMLLFGRIFWTYNVLQKATHDAARYMTSIPAEDFATSTRLFKAQKTAQTMVSNAVSTLGFPANYYQVAVLCDNAICEYNSSNSLPNILTVSVKVNLVDDNFYLFTGDFFAPDSSFITIKSIAMMRFVY